MLVPVRYPLINSTVRTITHAVELSTELEDAPLYFLHVNLIQNGADITANELKQAIHHEVGPLQNASYNINRAFLLEEEILNEANHLHPDYIIIGQSLRGRLMQLVAKFLGLGVDLESYLKQHLQAEIVVV